MNMSFEENIKQKLNKEFWQHKLKLLNGLDLFNFSKTKNVEKRKKAESPLIPDELIEEVSSLCNDSYFLSYTFYLTILHILLDHYNDVDKVITGGYSLGNKAETYDKISEQLVFYISKIDKNKSFKQLFTELKEEASSVSRHEGMSKKNFKDLVDSKLNTNLFNVGFVIGGVNDPIKKSDFDLLIRINENKGTRFVIEPSKNGYKFDSLERFAQNYVYLLKEIVNNLYTPIYELNFISSSELNELQSFNSNDKDIAYETIHSLFEKQVVISEDKKAVIYNNESWTYKELNTKANRIAHHIIEEHSVGPDKLIGVMMSKSNWMIKTLLAVLKSGNAYVPIDPKYPKQRIKYLIENSGIDLLITESNLLSDLDFYKGSFLVIDVQFDLLPDNDLNIGESSSSSDLAYMIYTSGSTGSPKGVMVEHKSICNTLLWRKSFYELGGNDVNLQLPSYSFDSSVEDIFSIIISGGILVIPEEESKTDSRYLQRLITHHTITHLLATPSLYRILLEEIPEALRKLKAITVAGEAINESLVNRHYELVPKTPLFNEYGPTENSVCSTAGKLIPDEPVHIGSPISNVSTYIMDDQFKIVPIGVKGELCVGGIGLARGYYGEEKLTSKKFITININGTSVLIYRTGDNARWLSDGRIEFLGRSDRQVKVRGYRIEINEVESLISKLPEVKQFAAISVDNEEDGLKLVGFVVCHEGNDLHQITDNARRQLPHYMVPEKFIDLEELPITVHGKVDYNQLHTLLVREHEDIENSNYVGPSTLLEENLVKIWEEVLNKEKISVTDDFFTLGGHSLRAVQIISRIQKELGIKIEMKTLFSNPTIKALAQILEDDSPLIEFVPIKANPNKDGFYELSNAQKRLWFLSQFEAGSSAYNSTSAYTLKGDLKIDLLGSAFDYLIRRHESLRTTFVVREEKPLQYVHDSEMVEFKLEIIDLSNDKFGEQTAKNIAKIDATKPFDLERGPLLRGTIIKLSENQHVMLLSIHHIISDGWSMPVLFKDVIKAYNCLLENTKVELPELKIQYKDYAAWQNELLDSQDFIKHEKFWFDKFNGDITVLELLTDNPRPTVKSYDGSFHSYELGPEHTVIIADLASKFDASKFIIIQAIIKVLLFKYTGQTDITIGSLIAGRDHVDLEDQIGFYVNTIPLRTKFNADDAFGHFVEKIRQNTLEVFDHSIYPFDVLIDKLDLSRSLNRSPLFDVLLVLQNVEQNTANQLRDLSVIPFEFEFNKSKFDLSFYFTEKDEYHFDLKIEYDTDLFSPQRIENIFNHLRSLIESISQNSNESLGSIEYITSYDFNLINNFNDTAISFDEQATIHQLFENQCGSNNNATALIFNNQTFSYNYLEKEANKIANCLINNGHSVGEPVSVLLDRSERMIVVLLGILKTGGAYVPIDPSYPLERVEYMIADTSSRFLISENRYLDKCDKLQWEIDSLEYYMCFDADDSVDYDTYEKESKELWDYVANKTENSAGASGWIDSYSGNVFQDTEIKEMVENVCTKLQPFLNKETVVLEVGCGSGLIIKELAHKVNKYYGTDISGEVLKKCSAELKSNNISNVLLHHLSALEIASLKDEKFDVIIVNSVIQYFPSHQYLRDFLSIASKLLSENGILFIGDIRDKNLQYEYYHSLSKGNGINDLDLVKKKYSESELFLPETFFTDYFNEQNFESFLQPSKKTGVIKNELSLYRFDMLVKVNKGLQSVNNCKVRKYQLSEKDISICSDKKNDKAIQSTDLAYIIYTSGSTGRPKGVEIQHYSVVNFLLSMEKQLGFGKDDSILATTTYTFDISVLEFFLPLITGGQLQLATRESVHDGIKFQEVLVQNKPTFLQATPSFWKMLIDSGWKGSPLMNLLVGGEYLDPKLGEKLLNLGATVCNLYGPTETTIWSTYQKIKNVEDLSSIGKPIDNTSIYILDSQKRILPIGIEGEIYIGGKGLARGYTNNVELTKSRFVEHEDIEERLYKTGDLGRWFIDGQIEYRGRSDSQIKIRGYRIEPGEIESAIKALNIVDDVLVYAQKDHLDDKILVAYLISKNSVDVSLLKKDLAQSLPAYMIPTYFVDIDSIPLTSNGKIDYKSLPAGNKGSLDGASNDYVKPSNELEESITQIWEVILGIKNPSVHDNFFEIGGHSIRATQVVSKIYVELKVKVDVKHIFLYPTIRKLAGYLKNLQKEDNVTIPLAANNSSYSISNAQKRLWVFSQINKKSIAYNMPGAYLIQGKLNIDALQQSFSQLVERHEILRTSFQMLKGQPRQVVHPFDSLDVIIDILDRSEFIDNPQSLKLLVEEKLSVPFELDKVPLFKANCIKIQEEQYLFLFVIHHIIADAWSVKVVIGELFEIYKSIVQDSNPRLPVLNIQYKDYCEWHLNMMRLGKMIKSREFWKDKFRSIPEPLDLPTDFPRNINRSYNGNIVTQKLNKKLLKKVDSFNKDKATTMFTTLLASIKILLFKYTNNSDIVIGVPVAGRNHFDLENQIGFYVNTLPIRTVFDPSDTFIQVFEKVKSEFINSSEHQNYPFDDIVNEVINVHNSNRSPLFDVLVEFLEEKKDPFEKFNDIGLKIDHYEIESNTSKFDLSFKFRFDDDLYLDIEYNTDLFIEQTIQRIWNHWLNIITAISENKQNKIGKWELTDSIHNY